MVWFLVRDVFHYWSYLPQGYDIYSQKVNIVAEESFTADIVYREDYTGTVSIVIFFALWTFAYLRRNRILGMIRIYTEKR